MIAFVGRRLLQGVPILFLSSVAVFLLLHLFPGDAAQNMAGELAQPSTVQALRKEMGLDQPLPVQYWVWISHVLRGDLGRSSLSGLPVTYLIGLRLPATTELAVGAMLVSLLIGLPLGIGAAVRTGRLFSWAVLLFNAMALAVPAFWLGILSILLFAVALGWLPAGGFIDMRSNPLGGMRTLILPILTLGLPIAAELGRQVRSAMREVLNEDYVRTARAKGLDSRRVLVGHALRNAMLPVVTVAALQFGRLLGGAVIVEVVFTLPGLGSFLVSSVGQRDIVVVQGTLLVYVLVFIIVNLLADISYGLIDPRIRLHG